MDEKNFDLLSTGLKNLSVAATEGQLGSLVKFYELVADANARFNLTAIADERDFVVKHLLDSAAAIPLIPTGARLLDIGSGAGFPAVPIAILREDVFVTALDSTVKKTAFIAESARSLGLKNLSVVAGRAEEQTSLFGTFDCVMARAVASLNILLELAAPMLKVGGAFVAYKSDESELASAENALRTLKMHPICAKSFEIEGNSRALLAFEKTAPTPPQYPRRYGAIKKSPL